MAKMSWSVGSDGMSGEVGGVIERQFEAMPACPEPEEKLKQSARQTIALAVAAQVPETLLSVKAWGSQSTVAGAEGAPDSVKNSLTILVEQQ